MFKEFKEFAFKGNVLDLAIAVIIGAAFGKVVTSLVNDVLMPPIGLVLGKVDFSNLFFEPQWRLLPVAPSGENSRSPDSELRVIRQRDHRFSHRRLCDLPGCSPGESSQSQDDSSKRRNARGTHPSGEISD